MSETSPAPVRSTIRMWCYASVPYLLLSVLVILLRPTPGMLAHIFFPFLIAFWLALYICIAWTIVTIVRGGNGASNSSGSPRDVVGIARSINRRAACRVLLARKYGVSFGSRPVQ